MRSRLLHIASCLLLTAATCAAQATDLTQQRQYYDEAKRALAKGDKGPYLRYAQALSDYPLTPYLPTTSLPPASKAPATRRSKAFSPSMATCPRPTG